MARVIEAMPQDPELFLLKHLESKIGKTNVSNSNQNETKILFCIFAWEHSH